MRPADDERASRVVHEVKIRARDVVFDLFRETSLTTNSQRNGKQQKEQKTNSFLLSIQSAFRSFVPTRRAFSRTPYGAAKTENWLLNQATPNLRSVMMTSKMPQPSSCPPKLRLTGVGVENAEEAIDERVLSKVCC